MVPWRELGRTRVGSRDLILAQRGDEFAIRVGGAELMNSRQHGSEEALAKLGCAGLSKVSGARVLIGGLGMGFTARAALDSLPRDAKVTIVELVPEVVAWNREHLGDLARRPLDDKRVQVIVGDVADHMRGPYHAVLLDVDNGPDAFTSPDNAKLYGMKGLIGWHKSLYPGGALAVWSVENDKGFTERMRAVGFDVRYEYVPSRPGSKIDHVIWVGRRVDQPARSTKPRR